MSIKKIGRQRRPERPADLRNVAPPCLLIVTEEGYEKDPAFAEKVRDCAAYFINVEET